MGPATKTSDKGGKGEGKERSPTNSKSLATHNGKEISILKDYSPELHKNILVFQCYKCEFSTNIDQNFKSHMESLHNMDPTKHNTFMALDNTVVTKENKASNNELKIDPSLEILKSNEGNRLDNESSTSYSIVLKLLTEGILKSLQFPIGSTEKEEACKDITTVKVDKMANHSKLPLESST